MFRFGLLLIVVACIALAVTNPGAEDHKEVVYQTLSQKMGAEGFLGEMAGSALGSLDVVPLQYHNYLLFSTVTYRDDTLSVGALTNVWALKRGG
jgi:hypothetical protein